jgi:hypothetical protein
MSTVAQELGAELDRLITRGETLQLGLALHGNLLSLEDLERQLTERKAEAGNAKPRSRTKGAPTAKATAESLAEAAPKFQDRYETWYTEALAVIRQLLPDREADFRDLYKLERRKEITYDTYTLSDYQIGLVITRGWNKEEVFDPDTAAYTKFTQQLNLVNAARAILDSRLADIRGVLQADLFDSELDAARELTANGYVRASGMVAGVVLEAHLADVAQAHNLTFRRKNPTISHYNDALKDAGVLDVPKWRFIQRLGDIRNLCAHPKERDPTSEEVTELIDGADRAAKTIH